MMNITLDQELEKIMTEKVSDDLYTSSSQHILQDQITIVLSTKTHR